MNPSVRFHGRQRKTTSAYNSNVNAFDQLHPTLYGRIASHRTRTHSKHITRSRIQIIRNWYALRCLNSHLPTEWHMQKITCGARGWGSLHRHEFSLTLSRSPFIRHSFPHSSRPAHVQSKNVRHYERKQKEVAHGSQLTPCAIYLNTMCAGTVVRGHEYATKEKFISLIKISTPYRNLFIVLQWKRSDWKTCIWCSMATCSLIPFNWYSSTNTSGRRTASATNTKYPHESRAQAPRGNCKDVEQRKLATVLVCALFYEKSSICSDSSVI